MKLVLGDITEFIGDAIVNAANSKLWPGGGVDGSIREKAGEDITSATDMLESCPVGYAKSTPGYKLAVKRVIHAVAPHYGYNNKENQFLEMAYDFACARAIKENLKTIAFPLLGTGAFGWPLEDGAEVAVNTLKSWGNRLDITLYAFDQETYDILNNLL